MKKTVRKIFAVLMIACLLVGAMSTTAFAAKSQTEIHIHHVGDVREGNGEVTVIIDGVSYPGYKKGSTLTVDLGTEDNGFSMGADGSKEIQFQSGDKSGTIIVTHKEGNGTFIENEKDKGVNNFNGEIKNTPPVNNDPPAGGNPATAATARPVMTANPPTPL